MMTPASVMKKCTDEYITPLTYPINYSIRQRIFPEELKIAKNYRLISVLPFFSKIYEKVMANFFTNFLDENAFFLIPHSLALDTIIVPVMLLSHS